MAKLGTGMLKKQNKAKNRADPVRAPILLLPRSAAVGLRFTKPKHRFEGRGRSSDGGVEGWPRAARRATRPGTAQTAPLRSLSTPATGPAGSPRREGHEASGLRGHEWEGRETGGESGEAALRPGSQNGSQDLRLVLPRVLAKTLHPPFSELRAGNR